MEWTGSSVREDTGVGGTERGRRPSGVPPTPVAEAAEALVTSTSNPEVLERPVRRTFTAEFKRRVLEEADRCTEPGQLGALLRREGLYSSHLFVWRKQREQGLQASLTAKRRGRKVRGKDPREQENERLRRENHKLRQRLQQAEVIIVFQKKLSDLLGIPLTTHPMNES